MNQITPKLDKNFQAMKPHIHKSRLGDCWFCYTRPITSCIGQGSSPETAWRDWQLIDGLMRRVLPYARR